MSRGPGLATSRTRDGVAWMLGWERTSAVEPSGVFVMDGSRNRSMWEMKVSHSLGDDAYLSLAKDDAHKHARIGCLDRSTGSVYTVARCGCHVWGRNRVSGHSRYVTCEMRH